MDQNNVVAQTQLPLIIIDADVRSSTGRLVRMENAIVDTGAQICVIGRELVSRLGIALKPMGETLPVGYGFSEQHDHDLYVFSIRVRTRDDGVQEIVDLPVVVSEGSNAVLGLPFLARFTYHISNDSNGRGILYLISLNAAASAIPEGVDQS